MDRDGAINLWHVVVNIFGTFACDTVTYTDRKWFKIFFLLSEKSPLDYWM